ncbi:hypothetical protein ATCV1_z305L [Acanthocystis turfacea chlorella virus 1]|uniref:Uncharacterized protein z305L n=1 Tax=Chlorovirus heliozoae TaxID=322019 RepID=A7K8R5_9PHYC|nr:hypothetical protein ATCV1_z305L [Acanthocystis turfacea chlorella virus 1]ABT16439.1 hypothetical protein ATCV1_z305L [Acanthocystis turfacea chlorella virus 1]
MLVYIPKCPPGTNDKCQRTFLKNVSGPYAILSKRRVATSFFTIGTPSKYTTAFSRIASFCSLMNSSSQFSVNLYSTGPWVSSRDSSVSNHAKNVECFAFFAIAMIPPLSGNTDWNSTASHESVGSMEWILA